MQHLLYFSAIAFLIAIAPWISQFSRIPVAVVEILLGSLAMHFGFLSKSESFDVVSHISFLYLMFLAGMEVNLRSFKILGTMFYKRVLLYFICLYSLSLTIVLVFKLSWIYVAIFPVMSVGIIVTLLRDYGKRLEWLNMAFRIGVLGELISIIALVIVQNGYSKHIDPSSPMYFWNLYSSFILLGLFILACALLFKINKIIFWWNPNLKLWFMPHNNKANQDIRFSFMLFFMLIGITTFIDIEDILGAFIAGMLIATFFSYKQDMVHKLNDIGFGFFIPLFFVYVGSTLDLEEIFSHFEIIRNGIYVAFAMLFIQLIAANIAFRGHFKSFKSTTLLAFSDCMPLTFLVAISSLALKLEAISHTQYYSLIIAATFEGIFFTIIIKILYYMWGNSINERG